MEDFKSNTEHLQVLMSHLVVRGTCLFSPCSIAECLVFKSRIHLAQSACSVLLLRGNWWIMDHPIMDATEAFYEMETTTWNFQINYKWTFLTFSVMGIMMNSNLPVQSRVLTQATISKQSHRYWGKSTDRETSHWVWFWHCDL